MKPLLPIKELLKQDILNIHTIQLWLYNYKIEFLTKTRNLSNEKREKYLYNNGKPFSCEDFTISEECIFIELYYKLKILTDLYVNTNDFKAFLITLKQIIHEKFLCESIIKKLNFEFPAEEINDSFLQVKIHNPSNSYSKLLINNEDFKTIINCKKLYEYAYIIKVYKQELNKILPKIAALNNIEEKTKIQSVELDFKIRRMQELKVKINTRLYYMKSFLLNY